MQHHPAYYNTIDQIYHSTWILQRLARIHLLKKIIERLWPSGHSTRFIHVTGTSGKGTVCQFLGMGIGLYERVGTLTSPHVFDYAERFHLQGHPAAPSDIMTVWENSLLPLCIDMAEQGTFLTTNELHVLMALALFQKHQITWAAIETGLGARYDRTMAIANEQVKATVLTTVGDDHRAQLGAQKWQRTIEKVGICRPGRPLFTAEQDPATLRIIEDMCKHVGGELFVTTADDVADVRRFYQERPDIQSQLLSSEHQLRNAALSLAVIHTLFPEWDKEAILERFVHTSLPGKLQEIEHGIFIDMAHNADKIAATVQEIRRRYPTRRKIFLVGLSKGRSAGEVLAPVLEVAQQVIITQPAYNGVAPEAVLEELAALHSPASLHMVPDPHEALAYAKGQRGEGDLLIVTGSVYLIDDLWNPDRCLHFLNASSGWRHHLPI